MFRSVLRLAAPASMEEADGNVDRIWEVQEEKLREFQKSLYEIEQEWDDPDYSVFIDCDIVDEFRIWNVIEVTPWSLLLSIILLYVYLQQYSRSFFMAFCLLLSSFLSFFALAFPFGEFVLGVRFSFHINMLLFYLQVKMMCLYAFAIIDTWKVSSKLIIPIEHSQKNAAKVNRLFHTLKHSYPLLI